MWRRGCARCRTGCPLRWALRHWCSSGWFYPSTYNFGQALGDSHFFYKTQRVGRLPDKSVSWRGDSLLQEYAINFNTKTYDFGGGWMTVRPPSAAPEPNRPAAPAAASKHIDACQAVFTTTSVQLAPS